MAPHPDSAVAHLLDRAAIRDVLLRYFRAVDLCDFDGVTACFTPDASGNFGGSWRANRDDLVEFISGVVNFHTTMHMMGNHFIEISGDTAQLDSLAMPMSDRHRIQDTLARCFFAYDEGDGERMAHCFVDDGEIVVTIGGQGEVDHMIGRAAIAEFCRKSFAGRTAITRHFIGNTFIEEDGNGDAVAVSYHTAISTRDATRSVDQTGYCRDRFAFEENGWKIVHRTYHCDAQPPA